MVGVAEELPHMGSVGGGLIDEHDYAGKFGLKFMHMIIYQPWADCVLVWQGMHTLSLIKQNGLQCMKMVAVSVHQLFSITHAYFI